MSVSAPPPNGPLPWPPAPTSPAPPQAPYPNQPAYAHPYSYPQPHSYPHRPPGMSEGTKAALIVGGVLGTVAIVAIVLFVVLPMLLGAVLFSQLDDMFEEYNPTAVEVGEAFQWNDSDYAAGWKVSGEAGERLRPTGLTFTSSDYALDSPPETYAISFVRDGVVITQASCDTENRIKSGSANKLECQPTDDVVGKYDAVVIGYPEDLETGDRWKPDSDEAA